MVIPSFLKRRTVNSVVLFFSLIIFFYFCGYYNSFCLSVKQVGCGCEEKLIFVIVYSFFLCVALFVTLNCYDFV